MKNAMNKHSLREIAQTKSRFLSIFTIIAISIGFFAGLSAAAPDMRLSADTYYKQQNLAHYRLVSTYGFNDDDIAALKELEGVTVYPGYFADTLVEMDGSKYVTRVISLGDTTADSGVNRPSLTEGRFPEAPNECIVDTGGLFSGNKVGGTITLSSGTDDPLSDTLANEEYTIVGVFESPVYIDMSARGNTTIGNGSIKSVIYVMEENFLTEVYTEINLTVDSLSDTAAYSDRYEEENRHMTAIIEAVGGNRENLRFEEIMSKAEEELSDAERELADEKAEAEAELSDAKQQLDDAAKEIEDGKQELADARAELDEAKETLEQSRIDLDDGWKQLEEGKKEFYDRISKAETAFTKEENTFLEKEEEYNSALAEFNEQKAQYEAGVAQYEAGVAEYEKQYALYQQLSALYASGVQLTPEMLAELAQQYPELFADETASLPTAEEVAAMGVQLEAAKAQLDQTGAQLEAAGQQIAAGQQQLDEAGALIESGRAQLEEAREQLEAAKADGEKELADSQKKLEDGEASYADGVEQYKQGEIDYAQGVADLEKGEDEYKDGLAEYEDGKAEFDEKIAEAEGKLQSARRDLEKLENPKWYVFDRDDNPGYAEYGQNADRITNIASVFPVFFLLVAALVCLTTMTRMVEEERTQIGTLKALGYRNGTIIGKYMVYALTATALGSLVGILGGQQLFPFAVMNAYGMLYSLPIMLTPIDWTLGAISLVVAAVLVSVTVYSVCRKELASCPAQLMRPKAPRAGKRILLEKTPLWKHFSFNSKVTCRNLFRYKRRMLMTVIGVAGCTALLLAGFGIRDSISGIVAKQYSELNLYDGLIAFESGDEDEIEEIKAELNNGGHCAMLYQKQITAKTDSTTISVYITVPESVEDMERYFVMRDRTTHEPFKLQDGTVLMSEKMCKLLGVEAGDEVTIFESATEQKTVTVGGVFENYPQHYIYMTSGDYESLFGAAPKYNMMAFSRDEEITDEDALSEQLMALDGVEGVRLTGNISGTFSSMLAALDSVIFIIIACAGLLAFVVLYNLTNINICERVREIATLKVLGFRDKEVDGYIFRENILLTLMGTIAGLFGGTFLTFFIISTAEIDVVMFGRDISVLSYVLAAVMTMLFSVLVSLYMHRYLKKIDMIEALKSVE